MFGTGLWFFLEIKCHKNNKFAKSLEWTILSAKLVNVIVMLVISLKLSASHLPEKAHCSVALSPILALGLFFQIALEVTVSLLSTKRENKSKMPFWD